MSQRRVGREVKVREEREVFAKVPVLGGNRFLDLEQQVGFGPGALGILLDCRACLGVRGIRNG